MERKVLDGATAVVAVSPLVQQEFQAMTKTPVELITNGFDDCEFNAEPFAMAYGGPAMDFCIAHTGLFAADGNPTVLWDVLSEKSKEDAEFRKHLKIKLIGKTDEQILKAIRDAGLEANLMNMGYLEHARAIDEQRKASLLILPLRKEPEYKAVLPGKLFEYLASWRPVMGIGQTDGAMSMILQDAKAGIVLDWDDKDSMRRYIDECWEKHIKGELKATEGEISRFSRINLTRRMAQLFERLTAHP